MGEHAIALRSHAAAQTMSLGDFYGVFCGVLMRRRLKRGAGDQNAGRHSAKFGGQSTRIRTINRRQNFDTKQAENARVAPKADHFPAAADVPHFHIPPLNSPMPASNYPILAPEGRVHLALAVAGGAMATWAFGLWSVAAWAVVLFIFQFFRDPKRRISAQPGAVVSPASGKVVAVRETDNPYLEGVKSLRISIFMNVFSVHSNLIPIGGVVKQRWYRAGKFFNAALDKSSADNERCAIWIKTAAGVDVVSVQIAGLIARRIFSYVEAGDEVETGQRYGFIRFGSRLDLYLPLEARLAVKLGQRVQSGNHVLGFVNTASA